MFVLLLPLLAATPIIGVATRSHSGGEPTLILLDTTMAAAAYLIGCRIGWSQGYDPTPTADSSAST